MGKAVDKQHVNLIAGVHVRKAIGIVETNVSETKLFSIL